MCKLYITKILINEAFLMLAISIWLIAESNRYQSVKLKKFSKYEFYIHSDLTHNTTIHHILANQHSLLFHPFANTIPV
jgi:hypothetical protein|nr:MAG TPA: hypothetical protein [Caudoviricetes sp.]